MPTFELNKGQLIKPVDINVIALSTTVSSGIDRTLWASVPSGSRVLIWGVDFAVNSDSHIIIWDSTDNYYDWLVNVGYGLSRNYYPFYLPLDGNKTYKVKGSTGTVQLTYTIHYSIVPNLKPQ